ncbi:AMP-binding protein [Devosia sp. Root685]|uniref:AMP-binding protein n=1 Tax=Devosia sp. Root685 TaxID=1736587 RepID=UPI0009EA0F95|nr:AMP-binding protein [Devosia sp. Root685]
MTDLLSPAENLALGQHYLSAGTVFGLLERQAEAFGPNDLFVLPEKVQVLWHEAQGSLSYADVLKAAIDLSNAFAGAGYVAGQRVAVSLENRPAHFLNWLALNRLGISVVPVNPDLREEEVEYLLRHSGASLLVRLDSHASRLDPVASSLNIPVMTSGGKVPAAGGALTSGEPALEQEAALIYTSGTTGTPKGCILSNRFFLNWAWWYGAQRGLIALEPGRERLMNPLPAFHVNAMGHSFMGMLGSGGAQIIIDRFHPRDWWDTARETKATAFHYLGVIPAILLQLPHSSDDRAHEVRFALGGGVHPDHHATFEARFGVPLLEGWAMTETGGAGTLCAAFEPRSIGERCIGSPDRSGPPLEIRLTDDDGKDVPPDRRGELLLRSGTGEARQGFFSGYLHDQEATEKAWSGGWLHTGDVMRRDESGRLYFVDRKKNIIRRSGENIAAAEVETVLASVPGLAQVAIIAALDPLRGEEVMAVVVSGTEDTAALAEALFDAAAQRLAYYKVPGLLLFVPSLPTTSTQKVQREKLRGIAQDPLAQPGCIDWRARKQNLRQAAH